VHGPGPVRVAVLGRGISGLAAAHFLARAGHDVVSIDPAVDPGGLIRSERIEGFLCETGPQALLDGPAETRALIAAAGLDARVVRAAPAARRRFIHAGGQLHALPTNPIALARSRLLGWRGKLRLLGEPFIRGVPAHGDESVLAFGARRFGAEAARALLAPAVIGVYAGDAAQLSAASALPRLAAFEREHGSVLRGALAQRRRRRKGDGGGSGGGGPGHAITFPEGLQELARALDQTLGSRRIVGRATRLQRTAAGWRVSLAGAAVDVDADAVVIATPARAAAELLDPVAPGAAADLRGVPIAPAVVVCLGFRGVDATGAGPRPATPVDLGMDLGAYGFLVAREPWAPGADVTLSTTILGCQYESSIFPGRAPAGAVLLRAILGGTFDPRIVNEGDDVIATRAIADLRRLAGLNREPDFVRIWRHREGIPQYDIGHAAKVARVDADLARHPGLYLIGHTLRGVGLNDCIAAAAALAARMP
jgi:oxygen-dependent protoporphyrinogen oxidase